LYDATQYISGVKSTVAKTLGIPQDNVRVQCPYTGGGFGSKGSTWSHVLLAAMAAKQTGRPVKLVVERPQMFGPLGSRPRTLQKITLGATKDGKLTAQRHEVIAHTSVMEDFLEPSAVLTRMLYDSEANVTSHRLVALNLGVPTFQRAPGEATGTFALESALDELAYKLKMDPIELRLKNYAEKDPESDKPWTSKNLRQCYTQAAERFGWAKRNAEPHSMRDGDKLIGWGMATATYPANRSGAQAVVRISSDGRVYVGSGSQDLGTGTYTIMQQTAADTVGVELSMVEVKLGDSTLPHAPVSGGSQSAASVLPAIREAATQARLKVIEMAIADADSPLHGAVPDAIAWKSGKLLLKSDPAKSESYAAILARHGSQPVEAQGEAQPGEDRDAMSAHSWGAVFAEVAVDPYVHMMQVRRVVATYDIGTLLNKKTGINQLVGGIVWGVSTALLEEAHIDPKYGRTVNENLAEYHVPVNADIGEIDVTVLDIPDTKFNPLGARGIGEIGITGASAAVANAIYHATGKRVRDLPITLDKLMG
jgi:xanthine dehydrogenase YagR molybdenum-binding subunit